MGREETNGKIIEKNAFGIVSELKRAGFLRTYFVGGFVRDGLLGLDLSKSIDIDIATEARPSEIKKIFKKHKIIQVGEAFNIVMIIIDGHKFEVATFREDVFAEEKEDRDGRHPKTVSYATPEEDAKRRDFTINGIFYDPVEKKYLDFVHGRDDIKRKIIKTIGEPNERFREDYLRLLRAIRFATQKNFKIEQETFKSIIEHAEEIKKISRERVLIEYGKIFESDYPSRGLSLLKETKLVYWNFLYGNEEISRIKTEDIGFSFVLDCMKRTAGKRLINWTLFFSLFKENKKNQLEIIKDIMVENRFDNKTIAGVLWLLENREIVRNWYGLDKFIKSEITIHPLFEKLLLILKAESESYNEQKKGSELKKKIEYMESFYEKFKSDETKWNQMKKFTLVNGKDLKKFNIRGKRIGEIVKLVKTKYISDELKNREEILSYINEIK